MPSPHQGPPTELLAPPATFTKETLDISGQCYHNQFCAWSNPTKLYTTGGNPNEHHAQETLQREQRENAIPMCVRSAFATRHTINPKRACSLAVLPSAYPGPQMQ